MKTAKLLTVLLLCATSATMARDHSTRRVQNVIITTAPEEDELIEFRRPEDLKRYLSDREEKRAEVIECVEKSYATTPDEGFQSAMSPLWVLAEKSNKFSFAIGGFVNLRTSYDFNGTVDNIDFVTYDIPVPGNYASKQQLQMDASTSRLYFTGTANTRALGCVKILIDMDFRGGTEGSYTPRARRAYASFLGVTIGRDVTTFCDQYAAPITVDFQGPNAYNFNFATVLRYQYSCVDDRLTAAVALEMPELSGTYGSTYEAIPQRIPDIPVYLQYRFGRNKTDHIRATAVFRNMYVYDATEAENERLFGWGVQLSGKLTMSHWMKMFFNGIYGYGITPYIQDLTGSGLDFTPQPNSSTHIQTTPMYGWQAAAQFNFTPRVWSSAGYSTVRIIDRNGGYYDDDEYKCGQYVFGNLFYSLTPRLRLACEYLWGYRRNVSSDNNYANRASLMAQYNF